jgi:hypothetical protein
MIDMGDDAEVAYVFHMAMRIDGSGVPAAG